MQPRERVISLFLHWPVSSSSANIQNEATSRLSTPTLYEECHCLTYYILQGGCLQYALLHQSRIALIYALKQAMLSLTMSSAAYYYPS